ncbi:HI1506-related protein [Asaia bogorensis]|uniref:HI1506-related protein n=1 Tax=Asaia bogorensis TaxID=91915 RepID=UPI00301631ED
MAKTPNRAQPGAHDKAATLEDTIQGGGGEAGPAPHADMGGVQEGVTIGSDAAGEILRHFPHSSDLEIGADGHTLSLHRDDSHEPHSGALQEDHEQRIGAHILLPNGHKRIVHAGSLIITCQEPGFRRAGIAHPAFAVHDAGRFSPNQIAQLRNESKLTVIEIG